MSTSITTPSMTWELESACHVMSRAVLRGHLDAKYGAGKWEIREFDRASDAEHGIMVLSRGLLAENAVECGLAELRRQIETMKTADRRD